MCRLDFGFNWEWGPKEAGGSAGVPAMSEVGRVDI